MSVTHGQCDARPMVTFAYAGTKFILLGDSWLPRLLILYHMHLNSLGLALCTGPDSYPSQYAGQASEHIFSLTVAHTTAMLSRQPNVRGYKIMVITLTLVLIPKINLWYYCPHGLGTDVVIRKVDMYLTGGNDVIQTCSIPEVTKNNKLAKYCLKSH